MRMTPPAKPGELFFGGAVSRDTSSGAAGNLPLEGKARGWADRCGNISKMWKNARNLLPGMGDLGGNAEMGVDKWGECGIICVSAGVLLL